MGGCLQGIEEGLTLSSPRFARLGRAIRVVSACRGTLLLASLRSARVCHSGLGLPWLTRPERPFRASRLPPSVRYLRPLVVLLRASRSVCGAPLRARLRCSARRCRRPWGGFALRGRGRSCRCERGRVTLPLAMLAPLSAVLALPPPSALTRALDSRGAPCRHRKVKNY